MGAGNHAIKDEVWKKVRMLLVEEQWSPEQISGVLARDGIHISHETIYRMIRRDKESGGEIPEITAMQTKAILSAACELKKEGKNPMPEIMVPLIGTLYELKQQKEVIQATAKEVFAAEGIEVEFEIGTMIEIPRAALTADRIATEAQYFSFGTNDLTQMTFGYSRDDIASFLPVYLDKKILKVDPFQVLDQKGVGRLIKFAVKEGREVRPELRCGICGRHHALFGRTKRRRLQRMVRSRCTPLSATH